MLSHLLHRPAWRVCAFLAFLALAGAIGIWVFGHSQSPTELRTVNIEHRDLRITIGTTGTIEPEEIVQVGPEVPGKLIRFGIDPDDVDKPIGVGSRVGKGTVLFQLDSEVFEIELQKARAAHRHAEAEVGRLSAQLNQAVRNRERAERLRTTNTQREYDSVVTAHEMAIAGLAIGQAQLEQAAAALRHAELRLEKTTVRSPIAGVVIDRRANLGQQVHTAQPGMFLLAKSIDTMRIRASVSESDVGRVKVGQAVTFTVDAHRDTELTGRVQQILLNARTHGNFVTYDVLVSIDKTDITLFPYMTANVEFEIIKRENAWLVPNAAVSWQPDDEQVEPKVLSEWKQNDGAVVWVPDEGTEGLRPIPVQLGIDDGVLTEVVGEGFHEDMPVVVGVVKKTTLARIIPSAKTTR